MTINTTTLRLVSKTLYDWNSFNVLHGCFLSCIFCLNWIHLRRRNLEKTLLSHCCWLWMYLFSLMLEETLETSLFHVTLSNHYYRRSCIGFWRTTYQIKWPDLWDLRCVCVSTHRSTPFLNNSKIKSCWSSQVHVRFTIPIFVCRLLQGKSFFNHCQTAERENRRNEMGPNPELPG